tara:strand:- start:17684 stop:18187 length:504 start_codon:yes stop_codon:yes gene_type:complete
MAAPKGNSFWKQRSSHGRNPIFKKPEQLWDACCEYFEWVEANPLQETQYKQANGEPVPVIIPKMRAMTIGGLCIFLDISEDTWREHRTREGFSGVTTRVEAIIRDQKFSGAAADLLNPNIIARDLGLKDMTATEHSGSIDSVSSLSDADLERIAAAGRPRASRKKKS